MTFLRRPKDVLKTSVSAGLASKFVLNKAALDLNSAIYVVDREQDLCKEHWDN